MTGRQGSIWIAAALLLTLAFLSLTVGKYPISYHDVFRVLASVFTGEHVDPTIANVIDNIRLPRVAAGVLTGAALAAAGATYQGIFRNPLVSPDVLGVSAGASLGAVVGIFLSLPVAIIQVLAFGGGLLAVAAVYAVGSKIRNRDPVLVLILAGVAIGALVGSGISLVKILADPYNQLPSITYWLLGSLASVDNADVLSVLPAFIVGLTPLILLRWRINLLSLEEEDARSLEVRTRLLRPILIASATLITSAAVSVTGTIGWIGLVIPHIARLLFGPDYRKLLPASMLLGASYLLVVDMLARSIALIEVPLGILTAAVGAPFFIWLLASGRRGWK